MPQAWSDKDERQYEHVKRSERQRGRSTAKAKEIAARTVNSQRRDEGRDSGERGGGAHTQRSTASYSIATRTYASRDARRGSPPRR